MYIKIGQIVNTHGIKGELKIISDFKYKDKIFVKDFNLYIGKNKECLTINTYRKYKIFDMVTFYNLNNINDVLIYKGEDVFVKKEDIKVDDYFDEDLIDYNIILNILDIVSNIIQGKNVEKNINKSYELIGNNTSFLYKKTIFKVKKDNK